MPTLEIYGDIGDSFFSKGITARSVSDWLSANASTAKEITVRINSNGGLVSDGVTIFNQLRSHPARVTTIVDGFALSAGSVIAMAGDEIIMQPGSIMMIHEPSGGVLGTAEDMEATAEALRKMGGGLVDIYAQRTGKPKDAVAALLEAESWFTAQEAVSEGFATKLGPVQVVGAKNAAPARFAASAWVNTYKNVPRNLLAALNAAALSAANPAPQESTTMPTDPYVSIRVELRAKGHSDEEIDDAIAYVPGNQARAESRPPQVPPVNRTPVRRAASADDAEIERRLLAKGFSADEIKAAAALPVTIVRDLGQGGE